MSLELYSLYAPQDHLRGFGRLMVDNRPIFCGPALVISEFGILDVKQVMEVLAISLHLTLQTAHSFFQDAIELILLFGDLTKLVKAQ